MPLLSSAPLLVCVWRSSPAPGGTQAVICALWHAQNDAECLCWLFYLCCQCYLDILSTFSYTGASCQLFKKSSIINRLLIIYVFIYFTGDSGDWSEVQSLLVSQWRSQIGLQILYLSCNNLVTSLHLCPTVSVLLNRLPAGNMNNGLCV